MLTDDEIKQRADEIGDRPAFPFPGVPTDGTDIPWLIVPRPGMTYRQWLEGKVLATLCDTLGFKDSAEGAELQAQALLERQARRELGC